MWPAYSANISIPTCLMAKAGMTCVNKSRLRGGDVVVLSPSPFVAGVLSATRLDEWFQVQDSLEAAGKWFDER